MTEAHYIPLEDRSVLAIKGADAKTFLQGILTNDITKLAVKQPLYALMLTPQGKFLFDIFLVEAEDGSILLEVESGRKDLLLKRLMMYRLRSKVEIADASGLDVFALLGSGTASQNEAGVIFTDPRHEKLGGRALLMRGKAEAHLASLGFKKANRGEYEEHRIRLGIADYQDMQPEKSFPLQFRMDEIGAIDFAKGCYVGQEVTARTKNRGTIRRISYVVEGEKALPKGVAVMLNGKQVGEICSASGKVGLAHLEIEELKQSITSQPEAEGIPLKIVYPSVA